MSLKAFSQLRNAISSNIEIGDIYFERLLSMAHFFKHILIWLSTFPKKLLKRLAHMSFTAAKQSKLSAANVTRGCSRTNEIHRGSARQRHLCSPGCLRGDADNTLCSNPIQVVCQLPFTSFSNLRANSHLQSFLKNQFQEHCCSHHL